jgi:hypothetical protein
MPDGYALFEAVNIVLVSVQHMNNKKDMCLKYAFFIASNLEKQTNNKSWIRNFGVLINRRKGDLSVPFSPPTPLQLMNFW